MKKLAVLIVFTLIFSLCISNTLLSAKTLEEIVGANPDIKKVNEKLEELKKYTTNKFSDVKTNSWFLSSVAKLTALKGVSGYPDGTFKPQNSTTTAEFVAMLLASMGYKQSAGKVQWYDNYVSKAKELGVIDSWDNYNYKEGIRRKDMAKMICRILDINPSNNGTVFKDVEGMDTGWIDAGFEEYLIRGYYNNGVRTFKPNQTATRAEVSEMVVRAIEYKDDPAAFKAKMKEIYEKSEREQDANQPTRKPMKIYQTDPHRPQPIVGDTFVRADGTEVVLEVGPSGVLGENQNCDLYGGMSYADGTTIENGELSDGKIYPVIGSTYLVDDHGEGHFWDEWKVIREKTNPTSRIKNPKDGQTEGKWWIAEDGEWFWRGPVNQ